MLLLLAQSTADLAGQAGLIVVALALIKVLDKAWDARALAKKKANGGDPVATIAQVLVELRTLVSQQTELTVRVSEEHRRAQGETNRRLERVEGKATRILDRLQPGSGTGGVT